MRHVFEQAFAKARGKSAANAIAGRNDWLQLRADQGGFVSRWLSSARTRLRAPQLS